MQAVRIDYKKCIGCKKCYDLCPEDVFVVNKKTGLPEAKHEGECWFCGICWMSCPKRCVDIKLPASLW